jgi:NADH:quinone reductase (non-electrogenic)
MGTIEKTHGRKHRVVIIGAGFGGLYAARALRHAPVDVTVIDRRNHHLFQPLLYQVATAALSPGDIAYPIRAILSRQKNTRVLLAEATAIDAKNRKVVLKDGEVEYDDLIISTGASDAYFGHDDWEPAAPGLKTLEDALEIRRRILYAFEQAEREPDASRRKALLTFIVVGGGPTGLELAGAIAEISRQVLRRDFRAINPADARVILVEAGPRILSAYPEDLSAKAKESLEKLGAEVWTGAPVTSITAERVVVGNQEIPCATTLWAAGVEASPLAKSLGVPLDKAGRVLVEPDLSIPGLSEISVIGDLAVFTHQTGKPLPGVAPLVIQRGRHAARNILLRVKAKPRRTFHYFDKGTLAAIGRAAAVADFGAVKISGFFAWLAYLFVHIFFLIGFRNRFVVMFEWAWAYVTMQRSARLITGDIDRILVPSRPRKE